MTIHIEHRLDLFIPEEIQHIIELGDALVLSEGKIKNNKIDYNIRNSRIAWIHPSPSTWWLFDKAIMVFKNSRPFNSRPFNSLQSMQYTLYDSKGAHYGWHKDIGSSDSIAKSRANVAIIQLSDPNDYKGGVLQIKHEDEIIDVMKTKGMVTTFPIDLEHRVTPIISGVRKTLIMWGLQK